MNVENQPWATLVCVKYLGGNKNMFIFTLTWTRNILFTMRRNMFIVGLKMFSDNS